MLWWLARSEESLATGDDWLAPGEAARAARMRFTKRRTEYLLRRLAAKSAVAAVAGLPCDRSSLHRIEVRSAGSGAPYVLLDGAACGYEVSITDRAGWAVCVVSPADMRAGCDLELVEPRSPGFLRDFLTDAERAHVAARADDHAAAVAANLIWSAKESALKLLQTGLGRDPRSIDVRIHGGHPDGWAPLEVRDLEGATLAGHWRRDGHFLLTVAAPVPMPAPVALEDPGILGRAQPRHTWLAQPLCG